jgi:hypothetical protein
MKLELFDAGIEFKYGASVVHNNEILNYFDRRKVNQELDKWCEQQFGKQFISTFNDFYFETEEQRNWFILRWS